MPRGRKEELLRVLKARFEANKGRHKGLTWDKVKERLEAPGDKLWPLSEMERTGGEPDVVGQNHNTGEYIFADCSAQSPAGRAGLCYDRKAMDGRKEHKPKGNAVDAAAAMGVDMLTEEEYSELQKLGDFDTTTSSWVKTPDDIRRQGGALYCNRRFGRVFVGNNGAESYFGSRGFRGKLAV